MTAELLAESDRRDRELDRQADAERAAYQRGHRDGYAQGYADADDDWHVALAPAREAARLAARNPDFAELERRRWGPGGRANFADARPGDYQGKRASA